eukprot:scaffold5772_cov105-Isochrysis_galbana.AAC.3
MAADDHGELLVQVAHETVAASEIMQRVVPHVPMTCGAAPASARTSLAVYASLRASRHASFLLTPYPQCRPATARDGVARPG